MSGAPDRERMRASTLELFFDLVFVLAITQVTALLRDDHTAAGIGRGLVILLLLWWAWSVYTWITNYTGTDLTLVRLSLLGAMGASMIMATGVAGAFGSAGPWFAISYMVVRLFGQLGYWIAARDDPLRREALLTFLPLATIAPVIVLAGGFVDDPARTWVWVAAIAVDAAGAINAGRGTWDVAPLHFAERNGLFIIIALGESIVAVGLGAIGAERSIELLLALSLGFLGAAALWWSYFQHAAPKAERHLVAADVKERGRFARDAYTVLHFPIVLGIVLYAVAIEEAVAHPLHHLGDFGRYSLAAGMALVLLAIIAATYRASRRIPRERLLAAAGLLLLAGVGEGMNALWFVAVSDAVVVLALLAERVARHKPPLAPPLTRGGA